MIGGLIVCASLFVVDGDTIKCNGQLMRLLGGGVPYVSGIDTPELRSYKCEKEAKLAKLARLRLKELMKRDGVRIVWSGAVDGTDSRRPLINIYLKDGREIGQLLLKEGFARTWTPHHRNDWCGS